MSRDSGRQDDRALVEACLDGDAAAWERLVRRYRRLIYSVPVALGLPADAADEVFQRVAVKLLEHLARVRRVESLASWLIVTTRRECRALRRATARLEPLDAGRSERCAEEPADPDARIDRVAREHVLARALERLGEPCRALLRALYVEDPRPSYAEISARLGRPVGSLGPTRARCLDKLRRIFAALGGTAP